MYTPYTSEDITNDLKVYIASVTGNAEARKQIQRILMTLDSLGVPFRSIDITIQENWDEREFMRQNAINPRCGSEIPLPPQIFFKEEYLGNYQDFDDAVENNRLEEFLRLIPPEDEISDEDMDESQASISGEESSGYDEEYEDMGEEDDDDEEYDEESEQGNDEYYTTYDDNEADVSTRAEIEPKNKKATASGREKISSEKSKPQELVKAKEKQIKNNTDTKPNKRTNEQEEKENAPKKQLPSAHSAKKDLSAEAKKSADKNTQKAQVVKVNDVSTKKDIRDKKELARKAENGDAPIDPKKKKSTKETEEKLETKKESPKKLVSTATNLKKEEIIKKKSGEKGSPSDQKNDAKKPEKKDDNNKGKTDRKIDQERKEPKKATVATKSKTNDVKAKNNKAIVKEESSIPTSGLVAKKGEKMATKSASVKENSQKLTDSSVKKLNEGGKKNEVVKKAEGKVLKQDSNVLEKKTTSKEKPKAVEADEYEYEYEYESDEPAEELETNKRATTKAVEIPNNKKEGNKAKLPQQNKNIELKHSAGSAKPETKKILNATPEKKIEQAATVKKEKPADIIPNDNKKGISTIKGKEPPKDEKSKNQVANDKLGKSSIGGKKQGESNTMTKPASSNNKGEIKKGLADDDEYEYEYYSTDEEELEKNESKSKEAIKNKSSKTVPSDRGQNSQPTPKTSTITKERAEETKTNAIPKAITKSAQTKKSELNDSKKLSTNLDQTKDAKGGLKKLVPDTKNPKVNIAPVTKPQESKPSATVKKSEINSIPAKKSDSNTTTKKIDESNEKPTNSFVSSEKNKSEKRVQDQQEKAKTVQKETFKPEEKQKESTEETTDFTFGQIPTVTRKNEEKKPTLIQGKADDAEYEYEYEYEDDD